MVKTIAIKNPRTRKIVTEAVAAGLGRTATEAAENLIDVGWNHERRGNSDRATELHSGGGSKEGDGAAKEQPHVHSADVKQPA